jgi:transcriptional regulator with XRE-family HTH domain
VAEFRPLLLPVAGDLAPPPAGKPDKRAALLPFVRRLRGLLAARGWGARELAAAAGVAPNTAQRWLHGAGFPQARALPALAAALGAPGLGAELAGHAAASRAARGGRRGWSAAEEAVLRANPDLPAAELARLLGRTPDAIQCRRRALGPRGLAEDGER